MVAQNMLHVYEVKQVFSEKKEIGSDDYVDVTKRIQQIEIPNLLHMCEPCSDIPSNISTMVTSNHVLK